MSKAFFTLFGCLLFFSSLGVELTSRSSIVVTGTNATLHWETDVPCGTRAQVTPAQAQIRPVPDKSPSREHDITISGLRHGVSYTVIFGTARVWLGTNAFSMDSDSAQVTSKKSAPISSSEPVRASAKGPGASTRGEAVAPPTKQIWGNLPSLPDHFARHGRDFGATSPEDYAQMSWAFLRQARSQGFPAKVDDEGVIRVFDPKTGTFAAYNRDGTAKTFFKPGSKDYFERQPGDAINLKKLESR
jgi:hypothetical protein